MALSSLPPISLADIEDAARLIDGAVLRTPCLPAPKLSALTGADIVVKVARDILSQSGSQGDVPSDDLRHVDAETYEFWTKSPGTNPEDHSCAVSSAGHPVRVVNGRHALFVAIDTLVDQSNKENVFGKGLLISGDRVRSLVKNVVNWTPKTENVAI